MIIYNITMMVNWSIHDAWMQWQKEEHIPDIMQTGCFQKVQMLRLLEVEEEEGPTYAIQYTAASKADYNRYMELFAPGLRKKAIQQWGDQFIAFRSVMEVVM